MVCEFYMLDVIDTSGVLLKTDLLCILHVYDMIYRIYVSSLPDIFARPYILDLLSTDMHIINRNPIDAPGDRIVNSRRPRLVIKWRPS